MTGTEEERPIPSAPHAIVEGEVDAKAAPEIWVLWSTVSIAAAVGASATAAARASVVTVRAIWEGDADAAPDSPGRTVARSLTPGVVAEEHVCVGVTLAIARVAGVVAEEHVCVGVTLENPLSDAIVDAETAPPISPTGAAVDQETDAGTSDPELAAAGAVPVQFTPDGERAAPPDSAGPTVEGASVETEVVVLAATVGCTEDQTTASGVVSDATSTDDAGSATSAEVGPCEGASGLRPCSVE